jgi:hypothetical protein
VKPANLWDLTPKHCVHGVRKDIRVTTVMRDDETKPRTATLVTPRCGHHGCPIQMFDHKRED